MAEYERSSGERRRDDTAQVGFRTDGHWSAQDLVEFARAVSDLYEPLLAVHLAAEQHRRSWHDTRHQLKRIEGASPSPFVHEWARAWRHALEHPFLDEAPGPLSFLAPWAFLPLQLPTLPSPETIYEQIEVYAPSGARLHVRRISIASPGGFSFEGLGEVAHQVRELVKDLSYRNRHERYMGELEVYEKYLDLQRKLGAEGVLVRPPWERRSLLVEIILRGWSALRRLEDEGKLLPPSQHLDWDPNE